MHSSDGIILSDECVSTKLRVTGNHVLVSLASPFCVYIIYIYIYFFFFKVPLCFSWLLILYYSVRLIA